jgi:hypothetical protein
MSLYEPGAGGTCRIHGRLIDHRCDDCDDAKEEPVWCATCGEDRDGANCDCERFETEQPQLRKSA